MVIGTPCSGPSRLPFFSAASAALALARLVPVHPDDRVELWIVCLDAREKVVEEFERADFLAADERGKLGRGLVVQLIHCESSAAGVAILASLQPAAIHHAIA